MRHSAIRVLFVVLLGLWSSLCCCQARAIIGQSCGGGQVAQAGAEPCRSCCHSPDERSGRDGGSHDEDDQDKPDGEDGDNPRRSPACPSCQAPQGASGLKLEFGPQDWERARAEVATLVLAAILPAPVHAPAVLAPPGRDSTPAVPRANRDALRWHCALVL